MSVRAVHPSPTPSLLPPIYMSDGSKGGVGKSMVSLALVDSLRQRDKPVLYLETDNANADTWRLLANEGAKENEIAMKALDFDGGDGWMDAVNFIHTYPEHTVVINMSARQNKGIRQHGGVMLACLPKLKRELVTLWVINRDPYCLEQLVDQFRDFKATRTHVVRNAYWGEEETFGLYNESKLRDVIEQDDGRSLTFPALAKRVALELAKQKWTIAQALSNGKLGLGETGELLRWRKAVHETLAPVLS